MSNVHVVLHPAGWAVKLAGQSIPTALLRTQREAIDVGRQHAQGLSI